MSASLLTPPAVEPWTLAEAKAFLRITTDDDDAVIASLIAAARGQIEALTRGALIAQTWRIVLDAWPTGGRIATPVFPVQGVVAARVFDEAGAPSSIDVQRFVIGDGSAITAPAWSLPPPGRALRGIEIDISAGYGAAASDVPAVLRHAVRTLIAHWYDNRGVAAIGGTVALLPAGVGAMIAPYRRLSL